MSLVKTAKDKAQPDAWLSPQETWEFVTVPDEDPLGKGFPDISLNKHVFSAGETYNVPKQVADYIKDRIKVFNRSCVRLLQPNRDIAAENAVYFGSKTASQVGSHPVDASGISTS
jgi:hypothetical protein